VAQPRNISKNTQIRKTPVDPLERIAVLAWTTARVHSRLPSRRPPAGPGREPWETGVRDGEEAARIYAEEALLAVATSVERGDPPSWTLQLTRLFAAKLTPDGKRRRSDGRLETPIFSVESTSGRGGASPGSGGDER
jgi:hypothetical protein